MISEEMFRVCLLNVLFVEFFFFVDIVLTDLELLSEKLLRDKIVHNMTLIID